MIWKYRGYYRPDPVPQPRFFERPKPRRPEQPQRQQRNPQQVKQVARRTVG